MTESKIVEPLSLNLAQESQYSKEKIVLDNWHYDNCTFVGCLLIYQGTAPTRLTNNTFSECQWELQGYASNTLAFLSSLYQAGGEFQDMVEGTFDSVRHRNSEVKKDG